jgi:hypothetical protein
MGREGLVYGFQCMTCQRKAGCHLSRRSAVNQGDLHAAQNGGHSVFLMRLGKSTLDVFHYPPHTIDRLPGLK